MRITFDDKSYVEMKRSDNPGKFLIIISAKDQENSLKRIINAVEIDKSQLQQLLSDLEAK